MHVTDRIKRAKRARVRGVWHVGDMSPPGEFFISDFLRSHFGVKQQELNNQLLI